MTAESELSDLRAENARLRELLASTHDQRAGGPGISARSVVAAFLVIVGAVLAPVSVLSNWAAREVTDTDTFVATFAPLAHDPAFQSFVSDKTISVVDEHLDVSALTRNAFSAFAQLNLPPRAKTALSTLEAPAAAGLNGLVDSTVRSYVKSDRFATLWGRLLRTTHAQMNATLSGQRTAVVVIGQGDSIGIQLGPVVSQVKTRLIKSGLPFASAIPAVNQTITVATASGVSSAQRAYRFLDVAGAWLPFVSLALLGAGVLVARRRAFSLSWAALGVVIGMLTTLSAIGVGRPVTVSALAPALMPADAAREIYRAAVSVLASTVVVVAVLALSVCLVAWFAGSSRSALRLRAACASRIEALRDYGTRRGITTGRFGVALARWRPIVRAAVALAGAGLIVVVRPLTAGLIVWTVVLALLVIALSELLARPARPINGDTT